MSRMAMAPCLVCGVELQNVMQDAENQPSEGTAFNTSGHYGSTAFDPMNGSALEINICDPCLTKAGQAGRVLWRREAKALVGAPPWRSSIFGWVEDPGPFVKWDPVLDVTDGERSIEPDWSKLERVPIDSKEELEALIEEKGVRLYGGVKLNGSFTAETVFAVEYAKDDGE